MNCNWLCDGVFVRRRLEGRGRGFPPVRFSYHCSPMSFSFQKCLNAIWAVIMILWINIISFASVIDWGCDH